MKFRRYDRPIMGRKIFISVILLLRAFLLVSGTHDTLRFFSYQNLCNAPLMLKSYIRNTLTFILKQYFFFYKIVHNSLQLFYIFHNNQLKLITLLYIVNIKNVKWQYTLYFKQYWGNSVIWEENKNTLTGPVNCKKTTRHPA